MFLLRYVCANSEILISTVLTNDMRPVEDFYLDSILTIIAIGVGFIVALTLMLSENTH